MRDIGLFSSYLLAVVVTGCVVAPWLYWAGHGLAAEFEVLSVLGEYRFPKYLRRALLVGALVWLWPFLKGLRIRSWASIGLKANSHFWRQLGTGAVVGVTGLLVVAGLRIALGYSTLPNGVRWDRVIEALGTAIAVPALEEPLFRGVLLGGIARYSAPSLALWSSAGFFAVLHFIKAPKGVPDSVVSVTSGFEAFPDLLWQFTQPERVLTQLVTLFLVGLVLGLATQRTRSLALALGLHAGWVFCLRLFGFSHKNLAHDFWFSNPLISGLVPSLMVALTLYWVHLRFSKTEH